MHFDNINIPQDSILGDGEAGGTASLRYLGSFLHRYFEMGAKARNLNRPEGPADQYYRSFVRCSVLIQGLG